MRTALITATFAALIAIGTLPAAAAEGPGHEAPGARGLSAVIVVDYDGDRRYDNRWDDEPRYGNPDWNRDWHNPGSYNQPSWGWGNGGWGNGGWGNGGWGNGGYNQHRQPLPERVIRHRIASQHFHDIGRLKLKNGTYRVNAENWRGQDVRLIVDAYNGRILDVERR